MQGGPLMHVIAAKAVVFKEANQKEFVAYQQAVLENALALAVELKKLGLRLVSGGTDNHLILVDLAECSFTGKQAEEALGNAGIVVNRNTVPFTNSHSALITGGIRLGTPAVTSRGFAADEMQRIAAFIVNILSHIDDLNIQKQVREEVCQMCQLFPMPGIDD
jgi:glycine hydroxymethyltransferase